MRKNGRKSSELRDIRIVKDYVSHPEGSVLIEFGETKVICNATIEKKVPNFLKGQNMGWVTAEYGMLPRSTNERMKREAKNRQSGRTMEIQRLIGRSLRSSVNLDKLGERTITIDCDVIQADGGTRTASITGAWVALYEAINFLLKSGKLSESPILDQVAAISCGIWNNQEIIDLDYNEDSSADTDGNFVLTASNGIVEIQATAEQNPFNKKQFLSLLKLAEIGTNKIFNIQRKSIGLD